MYLDVLPRRRIQLRWNMPAATIWLVEPQYGKVEESASSAITTPRTSSQFPFS